MKLRLRRSNQEKRSPLSDAMVASDADVTDEDSSSSQPTIDQAPDKGTPKQGTSAPPQFPRTFALEFPEEPFRTMPETPLRVTPQREPVWKKRLRYKGGNIPNTPISSDGSPSMPQTTSPQNQVTTESFPEHSRQDEKPSPVKGKENQRHENREPETEHNISALTEELFNTTDDDADKVSNQVKEKLDKTVSFDEAGLISTEKPHKKKSSRRKQDRGSLTVFDEESLDHLHRADSSYSDLFNNIIDDDDFSIATPTIYTDATDDNSTLSSYAPRPRGRSRTKRGHRRSRKVNDEDDSEDELFFGIPTGCRTMAFLEELKMFAELFGTNCSVSGCDRIEDQQPRRLRKGRSGRSRRHRLEA